jgi:hypothetical protein
MILKYRTFKKASDLCDFVNDEVGVKNVVNTSMYRVPAVYTSPPVTFHFLYYKAKKDEINDI